MRMHPDDIDPAAILAKRDQQLAEIRGGAKAVNAYLEGLENENVPDPLRSKLVRDFAIVFWRHALGVSEDDAMHGAPSEY